MTTITLTAEETATLEAGGSLTIEGTAPVIAPPPVVTPPPVVVPPPPIVAGNLPTTGPGVVYANGKMLWPGDWSGTQVSLNYSDTAGTPGSVDLAVKVNSAWGYWLPYILSLQTAGFKSLVLQLKPTVAGQKWSVQTYTSTSTTTDIVVGGVSDISKYGPAVPVVGQFNTYTIPLSAMASSNINLYKFLLQDQSGLGSNLWYVSYAALT